MRLGEDQRVQWLFWEDAFTFSERTIHGAGAIAEELERFVRAIRPYPSWRLGLSRQLRRAASLTQRGPKKLYRLLRGRSRPRHQA